ncbi:hypothetical protein LCGC14_1733880 [marine sediment metagenome]|uniref:Uncharacterized protein n=1 Tax=marine sediment metagenome TaxID=412755 RepID=A0A0F9HWF2_9ZZZZ
MADCPLIKENEDLKTENQRLRDKLQETIDEVRERLTDEKTDT